MKFIIGGLIMTLAFISPGSSGAEMPNEAAIKTSIESVAILADSRNFESLEKLYAEEVLVDYTSLSGGEPDLKSPPTLMTEWASVLPGFDRTRHAISNIQVHVNDDSANATADVVADHYLGNHYWQVKGDYSYTLKKEGADWKITMHRFNLRGETGSRDILKMALEAAAVHPVSYIKRQQTQNAVRDFLTALEEKDMAKFAAVWADDAVQEMPYSPGNFPKRIVGKENLIKHYSAWPANSGHATFTKELVFYQMMDPESVFVEYHGLVDIIPTGRVYDQRYAGLFHVENGKITLFREYYNPIAFSYAFGLNEGRQFDSKQKQ